MPGACGGMRAVKRCRMPPMKTGVLADIRLTTCLRVETVSVLVYIEVNQRTPITFHMQGVFTGFPSWQKQPDHIPHGPSFNRLSWAPGRER